MSEDGFLEGFIDPSLPEDLDEPGMEIQIDTLMGTSFDMRVSASDTVREIKQRIQRVEGIPVHQQNLIFQSEELRDSGRLCDAGIRDRSTIKLVTGMRGGPISTRRLSSTAAAIACEHHVMIKELKELLEKTRDEVGEKLTPGSKVSVLVFKDGDILNLLRVIENEDGSYSPYSGGKNNDRSASPPLNYARTTVGPGGNNTTGSSTTSTTGATRRESQIAMFQKLVEDRDMMKKISNLRRRMDDRRNHHRREGNDREVESEDEESSKLGYGYKLLTECASDLLEELEMLEREDEDRNKRNKSDVKAKRAKGAAGAKTLNDEEEEEIALKDKHRIPSIFAETRGFSHAKSTHMRTHNKYKTGDNLNKALHLTRLLVEQRRCPTPSGGGGGDNNPTAAAPADILVEETPEDHLWGPEVEFHDSAAAGLKHCKVGVLKQQRRHSLEIAGGGGKEEVSEFSGGDFCAGGATTSRNFLASTSGKEGGGEDRELCDLRDLYFNSHSSRPLYGRRSDKLPEIVSSDASSVDNNNNRNNKKDFYYYNFSPCKLPPISSSGGATTRSDILIESTSSGKRSRCGHCNKKLNITTVYNCRCGRIFCSQHRYSETHRCTYDYKTEGRRILEHQNPLVAAEKISRI